MHINNDTLQNYFNKSTKIVNQVTIFMEILQEESEINSHSTVKKEKKNFGYWEQKYDWNSKQAIAEKRHPTGMVKNIVSDHTYNWNNKKAVTAESRQSSGTVKKFSLLTEDMRLKQ